MLVRLLIAAAATLLWLRSAARAQISDLNLVAGWSEMEYEFPSAALRQQAIASGEYVRGVGSLYDVDIDYAGTEQRIFVTVPRVQRGVPITLGTLTNQTGAGGPLIRAYPDYTTNAMQGTNCDGLTSVFHIEIDACRRLWVLDQGKIGTSNTLLCQPQLLLYSLDTDALLSRYRLPIDQFKIGSSLWSSFTLDGADDCGAAATARAYLGDNRGHGLLVYDLAANASWRAQNKWTYPAPHAGTLRLAGESFDLMDGVFSVSLTPASAVVQLPAARRHGQQHANKPHRKPHRPAVGAGGGGQQTAPVTPPGLGHLGPGPVVIEPRQRSLYFHALASRFEVAVPLALLNNQSVWQASVEAQPQAFRPIGWRGVQAAAEVMDERRGNQFVGLIDPVAIACWNVHEAYTRRSLRVVAQNGETLQFASGLKVRRNVRLDRDELWVATNRQQKRANGSWRVGETNFRVQWVEMDRLVDVGGRCLGRALE